MMLAPAGLPAKLTVLLATANELESIKVTVMVDVVVPSAGTANGEAATVETFTSTLPTGVPETLYLKVPPEKASVPFVCVWA